MNILSILYSRHNRLGQQMQACNKSTGISQAPKTPMTRSTFATSRPSKLRESRPSHTLPQLPLPLPSLQLQPANRITQPLFLLPKLLYFELLQRTNPSRIRASPRTFRPRRSSSPRRRRAGSGSRGSVETALVQMTFCNQTLFPSCQFVEVRVDAGEQGFNFWGDF